MLVAAPQGPRSGLSSGDPGVVAPDDWVELYNAGATAVDLANWQLVMTDGTPAVETLGAGAAVLALSSGSSRAFRPGPI